MKFRFELNEVPLNKGAQRTKYMNIFDIFGNHIKIINLGHLMKRKLFLKLTIIQLSTYYKFNLKMTMNK